MRYMLHAGRAENCCAECQPSPCDPCDPCAAPTVRYWSRAASKSKCGYQPFDYDSSSGAYPSVIPYYLKKTVVLNGSGGDELGPCNAGVPSNVTCLTTGTNTFTTDPTTCAQTSSIGASWSNWPDSRPDRVGANPIEIPTSCFDDDSQNLPGDHSPYCSGSTVSGTAEHISYIAYVDGNGCDGGCAQYIEDWTLSDEFTTAQLKMDTLAALPAGFIAHGESPESAYVHLSNDQTSYAVRQLRYQLEVVVPPGGHYTAHWVERFVPEAGGTVINVVRSWELPEGSAAGASVESVFFDVPDATTNGATTIEDMTFSCDPPEP